MIRPQYIAECIERDAWLDLFMAAPDHVRESFGLSSSRVAGIGLLACRAIPITELNRAMAVGVERAPSRGDLDVAVAWLDQHAAASWALQIAPGNDVPAIRACIETVGLAATGAGWAKFTRSTEAEAGAPTQGTAPIQTVEADAADAFARAVVDGFGLPQGTTDWFAALVGRPGWRCFLATVDDQPAGAGAMFVRDGAAWLGIEATLPPYRGRGVQRSVIAEQLKAASAMGATVVTSETGQPAYRAEPVFSSFRNQERAGLTRAYIRPNYKRQS